MKKYILIMFIMLFLPVLGHTAFKQASVFNARAGGMGNAFIGISDDASAPVYNPAGLSLIDKYQIYFNYTRPYTGVELVDFNYSYFSFALPVSGLGVFGIGWDDFKASQLYEEYSILMSYAMTLDQVFSRSARHICAGVNVKYLFHSFQLDNRTEEDPVFLGGRSMGNIGFDVGIMFNEFLGKLPDLRVGLVVKNINEPDLGLSVNDPVYREFGLGLSYRINGNVKDRSEFMPSFDVTYRNEELNVGGGLEAVLLNKHLIVRGGANLNELTAGLGFMFKVKKLFEFDFNYAFLFPFGIKGSYGSHQLSLMLKI